MTLPPVNKFPEQLHRDVKASAAQKGISTKEFLIQALRYALQNDGVVKGKPIVGVEKNNRLGLDAGEASAHNVRNRERRNALTK